MSQEKRSGLVSAQWVHAHLSDPALVILDVRWRLDDALAGHRLYIEEHLPGAHFVDLERDLCAPEGGGRHPLPNRRDFVHAMRRVGIHPDSRVVVYDDLSGISAARLWWLLDVHGLPEVALLDGGLQAWKRAGMPTEKGEVHATKEGSFDGKPDERRWVEREHLVKNRLTLVDARAPERYRGEIEPIDPRAGHIPGAINLPFTENLDGPPGDGRFKPKQELINRFKLLVDKKPVFYCGSGVTACHNLLAWRVAGFPDALLYPGSWSEWCADPEAPIALGDQGEEE